MTTTGPLITIFLLVVVAPFVTPWLVRQKWFDRMTTYLAKQIDRVTGHDERT